MKQYLVELIGAFFLTLAVTFTLSTPIAVGLMLMALYYVGESVSGGYYNPALSVAGWMRGILPVEEMMLYSGVQSIGAFLGVALYRAITNNTYMPEMPADASFFMAFLVELLLVGLLALVLLTVATSKEFKGSVVNGAVIGLTLAAILYLGGLFNPAIAIGALVYNGLFIGTAGMPNEVFGIYVVAPVVGAIVAGLMYDYLHASKR